MGRLPNPIDVIQTPGNIENLARGLQGGRPKREKVGLGAAARARGATASAASVPPQRSPWGDPSILEARPDAVSKFVAAGWPPEWIFFSLSEARAFRNGYYFWHPDYRDGRQRYPVPFTGTVEEARTTGLRPSPPPSEILALFTGEPQRFLTPIRPRLIELLIDQRVPRPPTNLYPNLTAEAGSPVGWPNLAP